jgi:ABC-type multidrug transport system fused ATPase/permease subunit
MLRHYALLLSPAARRELAWLCLLAAVAGLLETAGVASVMPFLAVLAQPDLATSDPRIAALLSALGVAGTSSSLAVLGALVLIALLVTNAIAAASALRMLRFANRQGHALAVRLLATYLRQPYTFHLHRHSAELQKNVLQEVNRITVGMLVPSVDMIARAFVVLFLLALLVFVDPALALVVAVVLGAVYLALFWLVRVALQAAGRQSVESGTLRSLHAQESLSGVKEIKLLGREAEFVGRFAGWSRRWADAQATSQALSMLPRYAVEAIAFGFVLLVAIYLIAAGGAIGQVLPMLGLYAFAGYRLMPALHQLFSDWAALRYGRAALAVVMDDLEIAASEEAEAGRPAPLAFRQDIALAGVSYRYPGKEDWALRDLTLRIAKNTSVALVGPTGCGKTTVIDLLLGLLEPQKGSLTVDGVAVDRTRLRAWQRLVGHVPQQIFLCDDTIARNIAFGIADAEIDQAALERAARLAKLHDFVAGLPGGYGALAGERGVRLSGGERQRIGIARALYHDPDVLVLDEATSALDSVTENALLEALQALAGKKTVVMVAHRLSTVRGCDSIYVMEHGEIVERGRYDELISVSQRFRSLAATA